MMEAKTNQKKRHLMLSALVAIILLAAGTLVLLELGNSNPQVMYMVDDKDPYTGSMKEAGAVTLYTLDKTYNSVGYDMGQVRKVNRITLTNRNKIHRLSEGDLSVYVSKNNKTYTKVKDFDMVSVDDKVYLYNFSEKTRYVKVHNHFDMYEDNDGTYADTTGPLDKEDPSESGTFINQLTDMIRVAYEEELPGNGGGSFRKIGTVKVKPSASGEDLTAYIPYEDMEDMEGNYQEDKRDLRFVLEERVLVYWLDTDGVYVRVPEATKGKTIIIDVYGNNEKAVSLSSIEATFAVTYGNRTVVNLEETRFSDSIAVATAPNGDLIAVGTMMDDEVLQNGDLYIRRSKDGGRTWGTSEILIPCTKGENVADGGGFLVDDDTIWFFFHQGHKFDRMEENVLQLAVIKSTDDGYTWSAPEQIDTKHWYHVMYCDGVKTVSYDGKGSNIDYVAAYHFLEKPESSAFGCSVIYSKDDGKTWQTSKSKIGFDALGEYAESGVTEGAIAVLSDGTLKMLMRLQYEGVQYLGEAISKDNGLTWSQATESNVVAPNTMPALKNYGDKIQLLWAGNNGQGGTSQCRYPLNLAYSDNDMKTWKQKIDLWAGTPLATYMHHDLKGRRTATQPSMTLSSYKDSNDLFIGWWDTWSTAKGMLIEDWEDFLYKTKGAANDFEGVNAKYENWFAVDGIGTVRLNDSMAIGGKQALIIDDSDAPTVRASRSIPAMGSGEISFDLYPEVINTSLNIELKTAYASLRWDFDRMYIRIDKDGNIFSYDVRKRSEGEVIGTIAMKQWNRISIKFDFSKEKAELYVNGELLGDIMINQKNADEICYIQIFGSDAPSETTGLTCLIDNFRAYEGATLTTVK